jgi:dTDP-4-amino-4,6-dideoxygalactose transaminase
LGKKPKAIIAVHLYGMPYKVDEIREVANTYEIPIIEDSAEALGSFYKKKACGTFGDLSILSFNGNKIITTSGGGALVAPTKKLKEKAIFLATQARDNAPHYEHSTIGYNYRMSNISAGIGRGQMEVLDAHVALRRGIRYDFYDTLFQEWEGVQLAKEPNDDYFSNFWLSCILVDEQEAGFKPSEVQQMLASHSIECRPMWKPMHLQPVFRDAPYYGRGVSDRLFKMGVCLPSGSSLTPSEKERILIALSEVLRKRQK